MVFDVREEAIMSAQAFTRVFTENKKKIGNLTITTDNDEEDNEQIRNSTEIRDLSRAIQESFKPLVQNLRKFEQEYKAIMVAFQLDKDPQDAFYETYTEFPNLQAFENDINIWKERERQIVAKELSQNIEFVRVDVVPLKDALIAHCKQRQEMYVNILNKAASGIFNGICGDLDSTMVKMSKSPKTLDDLKALDVLLKESKEGLATIEAKFEPLQKQYELLERCSDILPVPDQETMLLLQLPSKFQAYKQFIAQQEVRMVDLKAAKKKELQASLDQLASDITATRKRFLAQVPFQDRIAVDDANGIIGEFRDEVKTHHAEEKRLLVGIELFGLEQRVIWTRLWDQWKTGQFNDLNAKGMDDAARRFTTDLLKKKTDCGHIEVWKALKTQVDSFKQSLPLITFLHNDDMRERHWEKLKEETQPFDRKSAEFTLKKVFEVAAEEAVIEKKIREVEQTWNEMEYIVSPYKQVARIGSTEDIEQQIDDHLMELASMKC
ncbi:putative Dynein axonemal heavy chain 2 [Blattamonas nauphoetae]|uniref:Dynein axonemal heavy chain 2 n=1 Tax=Blattamonas nauphoetae TaxID=2049346 RepID=A0ABQ9WYT1_9EUKA|nr:putative Dynein axonemal heavy chain 2 [Blattamonas nauphoetae]